MAKKLLIFTSFVPILIIFSVSNCNREKPLSEPSYPIIAETFTEHTITTDFMGAIHVAAADIDGDNDLDIVGAAYDDNEVAWWENDGLQNFTKHVISSTFEGARVVYSADLDGDLDDDLVGAAVLSNKIVWWENSRNNDFVEHTISGNFPGANYVFAKDMDSDGDFDVLGATWDFRERCADLIVWWENDGNSNYTEHTVSDKHDRNSCVYPCDIDSDSDQDILCAIYGDGKITWLENDGNQNFIEHLVAHFKEAHWVDAADLDGDYDIDIIGAAMSGQLTWWENKGTQSFIEHNISSTFWGAVSVAAVDINNDGNIDVLGASETDGRITWWENRGNGQFIFHDISKKAIDVICVYSKDIDKDGDLDVLDAAFRRANKISWWENKLNE